MYRLCVNKIKVKKFQNVYYYWRKWTENRKIMKMKNNNHHHIIMMSEATTQFLYKIVFMNIKKKKTTTRIHLWFAFLTSRKSRIWGNKNVRVCVSYTFKLFFYILLEIKLINNVVYILVKYLLLIQMLNFFFYLNSSKSYV